MCCLEQDLAALPAGDQTEIGERGINLSGGQKQRISLARAVYSDKAIVLLDDPLSAVDAHVGAHIFTQCIRGALAGKTILFVTHQLQYLPQCDTVVFFNDGVMAEQGGYDQLLAAGGGFTSLVEARQQDAAHEEDQPDAADRAERLQFVDVGDAVPADEGMVAEPPLHHETLQEAAEDGEEDRVVFPPATRAARQDVTHAPPSPTKAEEEQESGPPSASAKSQAQDADNARTSVDAGKALVTKEGRAEGAVGLHTYAQYARAAGGIPVAVLTVFLFLLTVLSQAFSNYWLSIWLAQGDGNPDNDVPGMAEDITLNPNLSTFALVYGMSAVGIIVLSVVRTLYYNHRVLVGSSTLHAKLFDTVVRAPMGFFDSTPTGRVLNRFSKDIDDVDVQLPGVLEQVMTNVIFIFVSIGVIASVFPWFLIACVPILLLYRYLVHYFGPTQRELKRMDNIARSPLFSHLTATLQGLPTLHAFNKKDAFKASFHDLMVRLRRLSNRADLPAQRGGSAAFPLETRHIASNLASHADPAVAEHQHTCVLCVLVRITMVCLSVGLGDYFHDRRDSTFGRRIEKHSRTSNPAGPVDAVVSP